MTHDDVSGYQELAQQSATGAGELSQLSKLAEEQVKAEAEVARLEGELEKARALARDFAERQVPELMDSIGIEEFKTSTGLKIKVQETIRASISAANGPRAYAWLRENGHAALIKRVLKVEFGKGQDEAAEAALKALEERDLDVDDKTAVNPQTLSAFAREKLREGADIPLDLLGVHRSRVSKIAN